MKKLTFLTAILLATTTFAQVPNYVPTNGLVGWWPFNGNANDESGNGLNGILINQQNGLAFSNDRYNNTNQSLIFNSISNQSNAPYIDIINSINSINNNYSINFWVKVSSNLITGEIINKGSDENSFFSRIQGTNSIAFGNLPTYINTSILIDTIEWKMYSFTFNSNGIGKLYIDGNLFYSQQISNPPLNNNNLSFGKMPSGGSNGSYYHYQGKLDDIGIWNRALTACEIKNLYNAGIPNSFQTQTALDTYTWPVNNQIYTQSGTYSDTLVNAAGCDSIVTLNLTLSYTGINELNKSQLVVSPNPTKDNFSITGLELLGTIASLEIKDAAGKVVKVLDPTATNFSCVGLKAGIYFLALSSNKTERVVKIIKE
jgi:hypothetical protein